MTNIITNLGDDNTFVQSLHNTRGSQYHHKRGEKESLRSISKQTDSITVNEPTVFHKVVELGPGKIFGELALISNKPRAATITCITDCHFAILNRRAFQLIKKNHETVLNKIVSNIRNIPCFHLMTKSALLKCQNFFSEKEYSHNNYIQKEGQKFTQLYLVLEGEFELSKVVHYKYKHDQEPVFDMKEFLPQTKHNYQYNVKNPRFINSVVNFKNRARHNLHEQVKISIMGPKSFYGLDEFTQGIDRVIHSIRCVTNKGRVLAVSKEHFDIISKHKDSPMESMLLQHSLSSEYKSANIVEKRGELKKIIDELVLDRPEGYLDEELAHMDEIREKFFVMGAKEEMQAKTNLLNRPPKQIIENSTDYIESKLSTQKFDYNPKKTIDFTFSSSCLIKDFNSMRQQNQSQNHPLQSDPTFMAQLTQISN